MIFSIPAIDEILDKLLYVPFDFDSIGTLIIFYEPDAGGNGGVPVSPVPGVGNILTNDRKEITANDG